MSIRVLAQRNKLAEEYARQAPYSVLFSADPGTAGNATNELSGGSPAYARVALGAPWSTPTATSSAISGSATHNVASGSTVAYSGVAVSAVATTNDIRDSVAVSSQAFASQGTYTVTPTYTQG